MEYVVPLLAAAWWLGFLARDGWPVTRFCYYIPPVPVALLGLIWLCIYRRRVSMIARAFMVATTAAAAIKMAAIDTVWHTPADPPAGAIRLVHWNAAWGVFGRDAVWATLAADRPDIIVFSEPPLADFEQRARRVIPNAQCHVGASMALASRWPIEVRGALIVPDVRSWHIRIALPDGPLDLLGIDIPSGPLLDRRRPLAGIARWVLDHGTEVPLLVVGDFNTPRDSIHFAPLRMLLSQAYESAGRGWPYSWPVPAPMWAIDQVWFSRDIHMWTHQFRIAPCSDHLREVMQLTIQRPPVGLPPASSRSQ